MPQPRAQPLIVSSSSKDRHPLGWSRPQGSRSGAGFRRKQRGELPGTAPRVPGGKQVLQDSWRQVPEGKGLNLRPKHPFFQPARVGRRAQPHPTRSRRYGRVGSSSAGATHAETSARGEPSSGRPRPSYRCHPNPAGCCSKRSPAALRGGGMARLPPPTRVLYLPLAGDSPHPALKSSAVARRADQKGGRGFLAGPGRMPKDAKAPLPLSPLTWPCHGHGAQGRTSPEPSCLRNLPRCSKSLLAAQLSFLEVANKTCALGEAAEPFLLAREDGSSELKGKSRTCPRIGCNRTTGR